MNFGFWAGWLWVGWLWDRFGTGLFRAWRGRGRDGLGCPPCPLCPPCKMKILAFFWRFLRIFRDFMKISEKCPPCEWINLHFGVKPPMFFRLSTVPGQGLIGLLFSWIGENWLVKIDWWTEGFGLLSPRNSCNSSSGLKIAEKYFSDLYWNSSSGLKIAEK